MNAASYAARYAERARPARPCVREGAGSAETLALLEAFAERHGAATGLTVRAVRARLGLPPAPYPLDRVPGLRFALAGVGVAAGVAPEALRWLLAPEAPNGPPSAEGA